MDRPCQPHAYQSQRLFGLLAALVMLIFLGGLSPHAQVNAEVIKNPRTDGGVSHMRADLTLAREKLGYSPRFSLEAGLRLTRERDRRFRREPPTRPIARP